ncbi:MAG: M48 family metalloprotease [Ferruginibacter sp.]|nr:M48 family metalloprotease [Bacteroidota bacterium]MBX2919298.1 M48 family metalloprotease [Ferruginibacter sp.]MCB0708216.1 M48 family metalloprotease [Chitinophagaceae bacterium]MCC7378197.1 M48 family metalloprotease [Chitinophagaceae bacterium]
MKRIFVFTFFIFAFVNTQAQKRVTGCGYIIPPKSMVANFQSVYEAKEIVDEMLQKINWNENFRLQERNGIQNAYATIINNMRWIVYDNDFLEDVDSYTHTKWSSISIMAHEMGHHYYNHVVSRTGSTPPKELEADAFSGYLMALMGASKDEAVAAIKAIASERASSTHPGKSDRVAAISNGWDQGAVAGNKPTPPTKPTTPVPTSPAPNPNTGSSGQTDPNTDPSWIFLTLQGTNNQTIQLSDDGKTFQDVTLEAGKPFVFKFEIYNYGWLRMKYYNGYRTYKLYHGTDYSILWNRRTNNWTLVAIKD